MIGLVAALIGVVMLDDNSNPRQTAIATGLISAGIAISLKGKQVQ